MAKTIFTIGHSTHDNETFLQMLQAFGVELLADVRTYPGSRHMPQFNQERLEPYLEERGINYCHFPSLGGRRNKIKDIDYSLVEGWRHSAFRNYSAYTLTEDFCKGREKLIDMADKQITCLMCAESVPWKCHRLIISNNLTFLGWEVRHIMDKDTTILHTINRYGAKAVCEQGRIIYPQEIQ